MGGRLYNAPMPCFVGYGFKQKFTTFSTITYIFVYIYLKIAAGLTVWAASCTVWKLLGMFDVLTTAWQYTFIAGLLLD